MMTRSALISHGDYTKELRKLLPDEAFAATPQKLWQLCAHSLVVTAGYLGFGNSSSVLAFGILSLIVGHSMACIAFLTHELSHNVIVRTRPLRLCLEVFFWALNLIPATVWRRVHNQTHHVNTNTLEDPDRRFLTSEQSLTTQWYSRIFYPHRHTVRWNPLVAFHFVPYILRNITAAFYPKKRKPGIVPFKPVYTFQQRAAIFLELLVIIVVQFAIFCMVGRSWFAYFWASPVVVLLTSGVVMTYVFTNHFLNPLGEITDPLMATTSVVVPPLFNCLHINFSYHTEHHLFPQMNSDFYPEVSRLLQRQYPDRYHRLPIGEAWRALWVGEQHIADAMTKIRPD